MKEIDWEQRRYEVALALFTHKDMSGAIAISFANEFIEKLKIENENNPV